MIGSEIEQGGIYAFSSSKYDRPRRCIVVDRWTGYGGSRAFFNGSEPPKHFVWQRAAATKKKPPKQFGIAVEYVLRDQIPDDQGGWKDVDLGTAWVPYAATSREILRPWAEQEAIDEEKAALARQRQETARRVEERNLRRSEILRAFNNAGSEWRSDWHRDRDKRLRLEGRRRLVEEIGERIQSAMDDHKTYPSGVSVAYEIVDRLVEEYGLDVTKPLPDPIAALQGRAS